MIIISVSILVLLLQAAFFRSAWLSTWLPVAFLGFCAWQSQGDILSQLVVLSVAIILVASQSSEESKILILCSTLGALLCLEAENFISLFLGIELLTIPLYGLIGNPKTALKYLLLASASSAFMLFGMALLYSDSASLQLRFDASLGAVLFFAGICFKLSLAPFHLWTADIYEDSPIWVTAFLATVSKIALVGVLEKLDPPLQMQPVLAMIAILSMLTGAFLTLGTSKTSRFLAYSSIAHMGTVLMAFLVGADIRFYMLVYSFSVLVILLKPESVFWAILGLLSLMGMPLTPVFWAKYQVLLSALATKHWLLVAVFLFSSLLSVYGYARLIARVYQKEGLKI